MLLPFSAEWEKKKFEHDNLAVKHCITSDMFASFPALASFPHECNYFEVSQSVIRKTEHFHLTLMQKIEK